MQGQGRPSSWIVGAVALAAVLWGRNAGAADMPDALRLDAQLADITFVDAERGWAVGDRGAIWHTSNGGESWRLQPSGVDVRLSSVQFLDQDRGWAAGGLIEPYTRLSRGVLLRTIDGGQHWTAETRLAVPAIRQIRFLDAKQGWAVAHPSALFPAGLFSTNDGGRSWSPASSAEGGHWLAGDFSESQTGVVVGRWGLAAVVRRQTIDPPTLPMPSARSLRHVKLISAHEAWAVGDGGLILASRDYGRNWQPVPTNLPTALCEQFDFARLAVYGPHRWIVGSPGAKVFYTGDAGKSWVAYDTGQSLPLRAVTFASADRGWAVGDLGVILATHDGGRSWRVQQSGGARAALLNVVSNPADASCELITRLAGDDGYRSVVACLGRASDESRESLAVDRESRLHEAVVRAGGCAGDANWRFAVPPKEFGWSVEQIGRDWDESHAGQGTAEFEAELVKTLRIWRPSVVVAATADAQASPVDSLLTRCLLSAVQKAGDAAACPQQISDAGLTPWRVQKVFGALPEGQTGNVNLSTSQFSARQGLMLADAATAARGLLRKDAFFCPTNRGFRLLIDHVPQDQGRRDFFSGLNLAPGGDARRALTVRADGNADSLRRTAQTRRNVQALIARAADQPQQTNRLAAELGAASRDMPTSQVAELFFQLGHQCQRHGQLELASETYAALVRQSPDHPLAGAALEWLVRYYSSGELAWRSERGQRASMQTIVAEPPAIDGAEPPLFDRDAAAELRRPAAAARGQRLVLPAGGVSAAARVEQNQSPMLNLRGGSDRRHRAIEFARILEERHPQLYADPATRFALASVERRLGSARQAERAYLGFRRAPRNDPWRDCALGEAWLIEPRGEPPKSSCRAARAAAPPHLDGRLDEPLWKSAGKVRLVAVPLGQPSPSTQRAAAVPSARSSQGLETANAVDAVLERQASEQLPAAVYVSRDDAYLYLGVECVKRAGVKSGRSPATRVRDADLADHDRVEILLDIDRDWITWYRLAVDSRGWTCDDCWGDASWNPAWYVAAAETDQVWSVEAAIPLAELASRAPAPSDVWAMGVQRITPGAGLQSWTEPAAVEPCGEGFGWLTFE